MKVIQAAVYKDGGKEGEVEDWEVVFFFLLRTAYGVCVCLVGCVMCSRCGCVCVWVFGCARVCVCVRVRACVGAGVPV